MFLSENATGGKSRSSGEEKVTQLSRNHGDKAKAGVGNQDPPTRHPDTQHETPAQRAAQVSGCSASRERCVVGEVKGQTLQRWRKQQSVNRDHMNSSVNGGVEGAEAAADLGSSLQEDGLARRRQMCRPAAGPEPPLSYGLSYGLSRGPGRGAEH